jgi:hypothetical protein
MRAGPWITGSLAALLATAALADDEAGSGRRVAPATKPSWEFGLTAYPTIVRNGNDYTSGIGVADRGPLHLEARINYESVGARSVFVGWTFAGGEELTWELTPLVGGAWGTTEAFVPALQASLGWGRLDFYIEAEYVRPSDKESKYVYAWSELGFRPVEWLRAGLVAQRTRSYGGERDIQRGPFAQVTWRRLTLGGFWFNPGSSDQVLVVSIGAAF